MVKPSLRKALLVEIRIDPEVPPEERRCWRPGDRGGQRGIAEEQGTGNARMGAVIGLAQWGRA